MREKYIYILSAAISLLTLLAGCTRVEKPDFGTEIKLMARMGAHLTVSEQTKADGSLEIGIVRTDKDGNDPWPEFSAKSPLIATLSDVDPEEGSLRTITDFHTLSNANPPVKTSVPQFFANATDKVRYAAWYPQGNYSAGVITFSVDGTSDVMYSDIAEGSMTTGFEVMDFHHALSLFRIYAYSSSSESLDWGNITSLVIGGLPDECTITLPTLSPESGHQINYSGTGLTLSHSEISVEIPDGIENKTLLKEWIAAPATIEELKGLTISATTQMGESPAVTSSTTIAHNFLPGHAYDIILRFSDKGVVNGEVQISDWIDGGEKTSDVSSSETFYNLSDTGTSNCYIVSSANFSYCFDATVKGNGNTDALVGASIETTINPKYVDTIWVEDAVKEHFELETERVVEGKVLFKLNGSDTFTDKSLQSEGNVLLGVYDEANRAKEPSEREYLWTWHIWITDKPKKQNYKKGYVALDRNLGATAPGPEGDDYSKMDGLFYQWGRPTPLRLIDDPTPEDNPNLNKKKIVDATTIFECVTPDKAVANPKIIYGDAVTINIDGTEMTYRDWIDRNVFPQVNNLWGYQRVEHEKPIKTIYDPCPHGYHVPYARTWETLEESWVDKLDWNALQAVHIMIENGHIWYPFQGYINIDGIYREGHIHIHGTGPKHDDTPIVEMWSSLINRHDSDDEGLTGIDEKINDSPYRFLFNATDGALLSDQYSNRDRGLAVRCVSNNTADVIKDLSASQTANCYMVHEKGYYKFDATVRGNGVGSLLPLGGNTTAEINGGLSTKISPAKVDILWWQGDFTTGTKDFPEVEIASQNEAPENMCLELLNNGVISEDGYVAFHIPEFKKGNVILAAYSDIGHILWTWHIWLTDEPKDILSGNYTKLDRFLGATYAPTIPESGTIDWGTAGDLAKQATLGFYYQWGRKDPLIGPPALSYDHDENISSDIALSSGWWKKNSDGTWSYVKSIPVSTSAPIIDVVRNPTTFYTSADRQGSVNSQWFPPTFADGYTNVALWGYAVADYSIKGQTFSKTMHDPCPPGYRTPFHFSWRYSATEKYAEGDDGSATTSLGSAETGFSSGGIVTNKTHFHKMWFPFCGYRDPQTGECEEVGATGYMNTGMPMGQYNTRTFWYNRIYSGQHDGGYGSAYGMMVRCMKE